MVGVRCVTILPFEGLRLICGVKNGDERLFNIYHFEPSEKVNSSRRKIVWQLVDKNIKYVQTIGPA
jgi:hypothetical protein